MPDTYKATITFDIDIPVGYEFDRFGLPTIGEPILNILGEMEIATRDSGHLNQIILRKIWQPPEYLRESKIRGVKRLGGIWFGLDDAGLLSIDLTHYGFPFAPPAVPKSQMSKP